MIASSESRARQVAIEKSIIPLIAVLAVIAILPFSVRRFLREEWLIGGLDLALAVLFGAIAWYVRRTGDVRRSGAMLPFAAFPWIIFLVHSQGVLYAYWAFPAMAATFFVLSPRLGVVTSGIAAIALMIALWPRVPGFELAILFAALILVPGFVYFFAKRAGEQAEELARLSLTDTLTGAGNRRALDARLAEALALRHRSSEPTALLVLDVDGFKRVNDSFGHARGDQVLVALSALIRSQMRACDGLYRFGGDEFVVVAPATDRRGATTLAEKLRELVEADGRNWGLSMSVTIGIAEVHEGESVTSLMHRVDEALFSGKRSGRNCIHIANAPAVPALSIAGIDS